MNDRDRIANWIGARIDMLAAERKRLYVKTQGERGDQSMKFTLLIYAAIESVDGAIRRLEDAREVLA